MRLHATEQSLCVHFKCFLVLLFLQGRLGQRSCSHYCSYGAGYGVAAVTCNIISTFIIVVYENDR
jgi:hypothetical protein